MTDALSPDLSALLQQAQTGSTPAKSAASDSALSPDLADLLSQSQQPKSSSPPAGTLTGPLANFGAGANEMLADTLGAPVDLVNWGLNKGIQGINRVAGSNIPQTTNPIGGSQTFKNALGIAGLNPDSVAPSDPFDQIVRGAGAGTMGMLAPGGVSVGTGAGLAKLLGYGALGGATGQIAAESVPDEYKPLAATAGNLLGGGIGALADAGLTAGANTLGKVARPFTQGGRAQIANDLVSKFAGGTPDIVQPGEIIPGSVPTLAEVTNNANVAGLQRAVRDINPQPFVEREQANNSARKNLFTGVSGTPDDIESAELMRDQISPAPLFKDGQSANVQPVVDQIDQILAGPSGNRSAVKNALTQIRAQLVDKNGNLTTDPETLYQSARKEIGDMLDPKAAVANPAGRQAARELMGVRDTLDGAISDAVPGFKQYLSSYRAASTPIDQMRFLQGLNLTDAQGNITLSKVQGALKNIAKLQSAPGVNGAKSLTPEQVSVLTSLRDDLLRASRVKGGTSLGSNTVQNAVNNFGLGRVGRLSVSALPTASGAVAGAAIGHLFGYPELGGLAGGAAGELGGKALNASAGAVRQELVSKLLNPSQAQPVPQAPFQRIFGVPVRNRPLDPAALRAGLVGLLAK